MGLNLGLFIDYIPIRVRVVFGLEKDSENLILKASNYP